MLQSVEADGNATAASANRLPSPDSAAILALGQAG
jgi:hypothetical protein